MRSSRSRPNTDTFSISDMAYCRRRMTLSSNASSNTYMKNKTGIVLMTYGSATVAEHVPEYLNTIYKGTAPLETITEFERRYRLIGYSPLVEITAIQARLLAEKLGTAYVVRSGMR